MWLRHPKFAPADSFQPNTTELAWAAGFVDGEGCFVANSRARRKGSVPYRSLNLLISQAGDGETLFDPPYALFRFKAAVGVGRIYGPYRNRRDRPIFRYQVSGLEQAQHVIAVLWPFLSPVKRGQAKQALLATRASWRAA